MTTAERCAIRKEHDRRFPGFLAKFPKTTYAEMRLANERDEQERIRGRKIRGEEPQGGIDAIR